MITFCSFSEPTVKFRIKEPPPPTSPLSLSQMLANKISAFCREIGENQKAEDFYKRAAELNPLVTALELFLPFVVTDSRR